MKEVSRMKTITIRSFKVAVPTIKKTTRTGTDVPVNFTAKAETTNVGRLAVDNELARMKYCV
jgi:hypothetical protein